MKLLKETWLPREKRMGWERGQGDYPGGGHHLQMGCQWEHHPDPHTGRLPDLPMCFLASTFPCFRRGHSL